jgi:hypothetical protein
VVEETAAEPAAREPARAARVTAEASPEEEPQRTIWLAVIAGTVAVGGILIFLLTRGGDREAAPAGAPAAPADATPVLVSSIPDAGAALAMPPDATPMARVVDARPPPPPDAAPRRPADARPPSRRDQWRELDRKARRAQRNGRLDEALELANDALEIRRSARTYSLKADILLDLGRRREALSAIDDAVAATPRSAQVWKTKGLLHWELEDYADAKKALRRYLELNPGAADKDQIQAIIDGL